MSEPTSAYTIADLVRVVAEEAGMCDFDDEGVSIIPINDAHDLEKCLDVVSEGIKTFIADAPATGWLWTKRLMQVDLAIMYSGIATDGEATSLTDSGIAESYDDDYFNSYTLKVTAGTGKGETAVITDYDGTLGKFTFAALSGGSTPDDTSEYRICRSTDVIDADSGRYLLNGYFGAVAGQICYVSNTNTGTRIDWVNEATIRQARENLSTTDHPYMASIRPYGTRQYELTVFPYPSAELTVEFPYEIVFDKVLLEAGVADSGGATTLVDSHLTKYADDYFNGWTLTVLTGTGKGETATVTDFDQGTGTLTFSALSGGSTPDSTSGYMLEPTTKYHPAGVRFDSVIRHACLAQAEQDIDGVNAGWVEYYVQKALPQAFKLDARLAPRKLGNMNRYNTYQRIRKIVTCNGD